MTSYLIDFNDGTSDSDIEEYLTANECVTVTVFNRLDKTYHVQANSHPPVTSIVSAIVNNDDTVITPLSVIEIPFLTESSTETIDSTNPDSWWKIYSLFDVDLDEQSIPVKKYGQGVNVYVVDSGIDISHSEFTNKDINLLFSFTDEFSDSAGHGTALSSLIVGNTCGLCDSSLNVVKIFDRNVPTKQSDLLHAFTAILADAEISDNRASVVNLSWHIPKNEFIESKIRCLINAGLMVIVAAGNSGTPISDVTPASMPEVFTIGSYGQNFTPSDFSNYSNSAISCTSDLTNFGALDSWAPGEDIYVATPNNNGYGRASGTSLSSAIYAGSVAYNISQYLVGTDDKSLPKAFRINPETNIANLSEISYGDRKGLLDLSDPKYASSINSISTYRDVYNATALDDMAVLTQMTRILAYQDISRSRRWIYSKLAASYEILTDLPTGIIFDGTFIIVNMKTAPVSDTHVDQHVIQIKINLTDGSSIIKTIEIIYVGTLFDPTALDENDPLLMLTLDENCKGVATPPCFYYCANGAYTCISLTSKTCSCVGG